jgi:ketosteroid isomerase-like protein
MKRSLMMGSLVLLAALSANAQPPSQSQSGIVEEIRKVDRERIQAQIHADSVALDRIYAEDFIGIGPSGTVRTKKDVLSDFASGSLRFQSITTDDVRIRVYGNAAVETGLSTMKGQDADKVVPEENRFTRVWIKQGGRWRLVANHYSKLVKGH